jgi:CBS domain-containing protein
LWAIFIRSGRAAANEETAMKVSDILRVKGGTLYTVSPDEPLSRAIEIMAEKDIGSLVVMEHGDLVGMLTFREVILCIVKNNGVVGDRRCARRWTTTR